jgi:hypothetical protein
MLLLCFGGMSTRAWTTWHAELMDLRDTAKFLREHSGGPVAVSHITRFHRLSFYSRRDLGSRVVYVSDPEAAVKFLGFDTVDRGLLALNEWFPLNVRWLGEWSAERPSFLLLGPISEWSWAPAAVAESGAEVRLAGVSAENLLLSVSGLKWSGARGPNDPSGRPMLYSRMPAAGRPLCELYLAAGSCPNVD